MDSNKFKTMLCKHWDTSNGCSFGSRCQFAHGVEELRSFSVFIILIKSSSIRNRHQLTKTSAKRIKEEMLRITRLLNVNIGSKVSK